MREIKFRGRVDERRPSMEGQWVYGSIVTQDQYAPYIRTITLEYIGVDEKTVGQYIGRKDKKHREIYEGDLVKDSNNYVYRVVYNEYFASFGLRRKQDAYMHYFGEAFESEDCEIIGNVHDNPELLEATK